MTTNTAQPLRDMTLSLLSNERAFLMNIIKDFKEVDQTFKPAHEMFSVAQQIRHIGFVIGWFREAVFGAGFDMDFEALHLQNTTEVTLVSAMEKITAEYEASIEAVMKSDDNFLTELMPDNAIVGKVPRYYCFLYQTDHTAHHRGALMVYLRLLGRTPQMVYS